MSRHRVNQRTQPLSTRLPSLRCGIIRWIRPANHVVNYPAMHPLDTADPTTQRKISVGQIHDYALWSQGSWGL